MPVLQNPRAQARAQLLANAPHPIREDPLTAGNIAALSTQAFIDDGFFTREIQAPEPQHEPPHAPAHAHARRAVDNLDALPMQLIDIGIMEESNLELNLELLDIGDPDDRDPKLKSIESSIIKYSGYPTTVTLEKLGFAYSDTNNSPRLVLEFLYDVNTKFVIKVDTSEAKSSPNIRTSLSHEKAIKEAYPQTLPIEVDYKVSKIPNPTGDFAQKIYEATVHYKPNEYLNKILE